MDITATEFSARLAAILTHISNAHFVALDFEMSGISMGKSKNKQSGTGNITGLSQKSSPITSPPVNICLECLGTPSPEISTQVSCSCLGSAESLSMSSTPSVSQSPSPSSSLARKQTLQKRYDEVRCAAEKYQILQVGITVAALDSRTGTYILRPYNISLSPMLRENVGIERTFSLQSSSVAFLLQHGFDFQKSLAHGVQYLSRSEEEKARFEEILLAHRNQTEVVDSLQDVGDHEGFVKNVRSKIEKWLELETRTKFLNIGLECFEANMQMNHIGLSNNRRRLVHQLVRAEFRDFVTESYPAYIQVRDRDEVREAGLATHRMATFESKLQRQIGLRHLMEAMVAGDSLHGLDPAIWLGPTHRGQRDGDTKKNLEQFESVKQKLRKPTILIGHNIFIDLINFYSCFIGKLPEDVNEFRDEIHELFPFVIDTKYLATHTNNRHDVRSGLEELDFELKDSVIPKIDCHPHHSRYTSPQQYLHEAGFDSYMTARVAIRLASRLDTSRPQTPEPISTAESCGNKLIPLKNNPPTAKTALQELEELFSINPLQIKESQCESPQIRLQFEEKAQLTPETQKPKPALFMPSFDNNFWKTYGNRLRVNGTAEEVLVLGDWST